MDKVIPRQQIRRYIGHDGIEYTVTRENSTGPRSPMLCSLDGYSLSSPFRPVPLPPFGALSIAHRETLRGEEVGKRSGELAEARAGQRRNGGQSRANRGTGRAVVYTPTSTG